MRIPFEKADAETQRFYSRVFWTVLVNLNAVQMGLYDTLLCETDDPRFAQKWKEDLPKMVAAMKKRKRELDDE